MLEFTSSEAFADALPDARGLPASSRAKAGEMTKQRARTNNNAFCLIVVR